MKWGRILFDSKLWRTACQGSDDGSDGSGQAARAPHANPCHMSSSVWLCQKAVEMLTSQGPSVLLQVLQDDCYCKTERRLQACTMGSGVVSTLAAAFSCAPAAGACVSAAAAFSALLPPEDRPFIMPANSPRSFFTAAASAALSFLSSSLKSALVESCRVGQRHEAPEQE